MIATKARTRFPCTPLLLHCPLGRPPIDSDSPQDGCWSDHAAWIKRPVSGALGLSKSFNKSITLLVPLVFGICDPATVRRGVWSIVVDTIDLLGVIVPRCSGPSGEGHEFSPVVADKDTSSSIPEETVMLVIATPLMHPIPNVIETSAASLPVLPMLDVPLLQGDRLASTRPRVTEELERANGSTRTAVTATGVEKNVVGIPTFSELLAEWLPSDDPSAKTLTSADAVGFHVSVIPEKDMVGNRQQT
jgi:hypothetical protein